MSCDLQIIVVGCGGTGSHYIKELGRLLYGRAGRDRIALTLVDGDVVEEKNLVRQAFLPDDVGRNKAEVMSEVLKDVYGITAEYFDDYIDSAEDLKSLIDLSRPLLMVGCVDNHQCRQSLHQLYESLPSCIYMDAANEFSAGEVVIGSRIGGIEMYPDRSFFFPEVLESKEKRRSEESCEVLNAVAPQHMLTNQMAAWIMLVFTNRVLDEGWAGGVVFFDALKCYSMDRTSQEGTRDGYRTDSSD